MAEEKKKGLLQKIFGSKPSCCSVQLEDAEQENQQEESEKKQNEAGRGCCSPRNESGNLR
ncbi:MAG: hypothetical protein U5L07_09630 [Desulfobacterales bacterium]|nr:hypothetical protein [Desulfobacterales bacterium]